MAQKFQIQIKNENLKVEKEETKIEFVMQNKNSDKMKFHLESYKTESSHNIVKRKSTKSKQKSPK